MLNHNHSQTSYNVLDRWGRRTKGGNPTVGRVPPQRNVLFLESRWHLRHLLHPSPQVPNCPMFQMVLFPFPLKVILKILHKMQNLQNLCQMPTMEFGFKHRQDRLGRLGNRKIKPETLGKAKVSSPKIIQAKVDMGEGGP
eukprot:EG_transcript_34102